MAKLAEVTKRDGTLEKPGNPRAALPIVAHDTPRLEPKRRSELEALAEKIRRQEPNLANTRPFGDLVSVGLEPLPSLVIEDHSWITLFEAVGDISYSHRACVLAGDGDLVVLGIRRCPAFEDYCRTTLGLGSFEVVSPRRQAAQESLSLRCARDADLIARVAATSRRHGGLNVIPYMGTGGVWFLAGRIAETSGKPVTLAAPPPQLTRRVNDKLWFGRRVREALGACALPESFEAYGLAALAKEVSILARRDATIAIKLPSSASSAGNLVLENRGFGGLSLEEQRRHIDARLRMAGWRKEFPLLVTTWESPILASPSVQLWIPLSDVGEVVVEGIFDQLLTGPRSEFRGAVPTTLSPALRQRLSDEAAALGYLFQRLGYFGRCSLDAIVVGEGEDVAQVHWVECNGRWGGASIPMTLSNRLIGDWVDAEFLVAERDDLSAPPWPFDDFCRNMTDLLFRRDAGSLGVVVLSPSRIETGAGYELLVLGRDRSDAQARVERVAAAFRARGSS